MESTVTKLRNESAAEWQGTEDEEGLGPGMTDVSYIHGQLPEKLISIRRRIGGTVGSDYDALS